MMQIVCYNLVQMLLMTVQLEKGIVELAQIGGVHLAEATHTAIALSFYCNSQEQSEQGAVEHTEVVIHVCLAVCVMIA
jgi:hypothetical protein